MKDGRIIQFGKYDDLIADKEGELSKQMDAHNKSLSQVTPAKVHGLTRNKKHKKKQMEVTEIEPDHNVLGRESEEERESGRVKWDIYHKFVTSAYRGALVPVILACQVLFQALQICSNYWIAWASSQEQVSREKMIGIFVLLSAGSSAFIMGRAFVLSAIAIETAQQLFLSMIKNIFRAPINFFDSTPSIRILNRVSTVNLPLRCNFIKNTLLPVSSLHISVFQASTDQSTVDIDIPYRLAGLIFALIQLLSIIFIMSQIAWPIFFLFIIIISISTCYQVHLHALLKTLTALTHKMHS